MQIDFSSLVDVRIIKDGSSGPRDVDASSVSEGPLDDKNASKPGSSSFINTQTVISSTGICYDTFLRLKIQLTRVKEVSKP